MNVLVDCYCISFIVDDFYFYQTLLVMIMCRVVVLLSVIIIIFAFVSSGVGGDAHELTYFYTAGWGRGGGSKELMKAVLQSGSDEPEIESSPAPSVLTEQSALSGVGTPTDGGTSSGADDKDVRAKVSEDSDKDVDGKRNDQITKDNFPKSTDQQLQQPPTPLSGQNEAFAAGGDTSGRDKADQVSTRDDGVSQTASTDNQGSKETSSDDEKRTDADTQTGDVGSKEGAANGTVENDGNTSNDNSADQKEVAVSNTKSGSGNDDNDKKKQLTSTTAAPKPTEEGDTDNTAVFSFAPQPRVFAWLLISLLTALATW